MNTENAEITLPNIGGYQYTGEFRVAVRGEWFLSPYTCEPKPAKFKTPSWVHIIKEVKRERE